MISSSSIEKHDAFSILFFCYLSLQSLSKCFCCLFESSTLVNMFCVESSKFGNMLKNTFLFSPISCSKPAKLSLPCRQAHPSQGRVPWVSCAEMMRTFCRRMYADAPNPGYPGVLWCFWRFTAKEGLVSLYSRPCHRNKSVGISPPRDGDIQSTTIVI